MVDTEMNKYNSYVDKFIINKIQIIPCRLSWNYKEEKKIAIFPTQWTQRTFTKQDFNYNNYPDLAIKTGEINNITVIDIDDENIIDEQLKILGISDLEEHPIVKTKKGLHIYYKYDVNMPNTVEYYKGVDIRNNGGCVFIPPSSYKIDENTQKYEFIGEWNIDVFIKSLRLMDDFIIPSDYIKIKKKEPIIQKEDYDLNSLNELKEEHKLYLELIPSDNRSVWFQIGSILKRLGYTQKCWDTWSKSCNKYNQLIQKNTWNDNLEQYNYNEAGLYALAYKFNPKKALSIKTKKYTIIVDRFMKTQRHKIDMAIMIKDLVKHLYCIQGKTHPEFIMPNKNNKWELKESPEINRYLSLDVREMFNNKVKSLKDNIELCETDEDLANVKAQIVFINKYIINSLGDSPHVYIPSLVNLTYDREKESKLDEINLNIINFDNGCYDLKNSCFRLPHLSEMVYKSTNYEYNPQVDEEIRLEIMTELKKIFRMANGSDDLLDYNLKINASCLSGENKYESFYCLTGSGANGKGLVDTLNKHTFGQYYGTIDSTFFTQVKKTSSGASPEIADKKGIRMLVSSECGQTEHLQADILKKMSGNDTLSTRQLYKTQFEFLPQFKLFFQFNGCPNLSSCDGGIKRRFVLVNYPTQFVNNPDIDYIFEQKINPSLKKKFTDIKYRQQYMLILIEYYNKYIRDDNSGRIPPPKIVEDYTKSFIYDNDIIQQFFDEKKLTVTKNKKDKVSVKTLFLLYKESNELYEMNRYGRNDFLKLIYNFDGLEKGKNNMGICVTGLKL